MTWRRETGSVGRDHPPSLNNTDVEPKDRGRGVWKRYPPNPRSQRDRGNRPPKTEKTPYNFYTRDPSMVLGRLVRPSGDTNDVHQWDRISSLTQCPVIYLVLRYFHYDQRTSWVTETFRSPNRRRWSDPPELLLVRPTLVTPTSRVFYNHLQKGHGATTV